MSYDDAARRAPRVVVVGGGITGLTTAYRVAQRRPDVELTLLERDRALGGNIRTESQAGFLIDAGPDSFLRTKPDAVELIEELGLSDELITPEARSVYIVHDGRLELMPAGMALAIPTRLGPMAKTPILSLGGKLRALSDLWLPRHWGQSDVVGAEDESIGAFVTRRFGAEAAERLVGPLLGGIYAGDISELSVRSTFPQLVELQEKHGSLIRGFFAAHRARVASQGRRGLLSWLTRRADSAPSPFYSLRRGMGSLVEALAKQLPQGVVRCGVAVKRVERVSGDQRRWNVVDDSDRSAPADAVVLAVPSHAAARMVTEPELASELGRIPYASTATVFFALGRQDVAHPLDGVGFLVPPGEADILAATWVSSKWTGRAPKAGVLMRAFVGGSRATIRVKQQSDEQLVAVARSELERLTGPLGPPLFTRVYRYPDANPQPVLGHAARLRRIQTRLGDLPGLHVAGAPYEGVGIPDCVKQASCVAERVLSELRPA